MRIQVKRTNLGGFTIGEYIYITFDDFMFPNFDIENFLNTNVTQEIIDYEYNIFEEEFGSRSYIHLIIDKFYQIKYGDYSSRPIKYSIEEIKKYIGFCIKLKKIYFDGKNNILVYTNINYKKQNIESYKDFDYKMMLLQGSKNHMFSKKIESVYCFILQEFISKIFSEYDLYKKRYILGSYYYSPCDISNNSEYLLMRISTDHVASVNEDFFSEYKKHFLKLIDNNEFENLNILGIMYCGEYAPKKNHKIHRKFTI